MEKGPAAKAFQERIFSKTLTAILVMSDLFKTYQSTPLAPVAEALEQVVSACKAALHVHGFVGVDVVTAPADVFVISQYKGKDVMLRKLLQPLLAGVVAK